jgi:hypothetical protein
MPFVPGFVMGAAAQPVGRPIWILNITGHSWKEAVDKLDVTSTLHGGVQALIAGILRGDGNIKGYIDNLNYIWNAPIRAGVFATMALGVGGVATLTIPGMITTVNEQGTVEGKGEYNFDFSLNLLASAAYAGSYGGTGAYLYPAA